MERKRPVQKGRQVEAKKRYAGPNLVVYGSIARLTLASSGSHFDGLGGMQNGAPCL